MVKTINILGTVSVIIGLAASVLCAIPFGIFYAIPVGFAGFLCTTVYIALNTRHQVNTKKINPGIIALLLNSVPLLYILIGIIATKLKGQPL
jgi:Na+/H+ antiporter NhaC